MINVTKKQIPNHFDTFKTKPANFSALLTFCITKLFISLSVSSSKLILKIFDNSFACLISGVVSFNSHFDIVYLVTFIFSARCS